ncbi:MAG: type II secretion system F family protein [Luteimonas sp.]
MAFNYDDISTWFAKLQLNPTVRSQIYDTLSMLLDNNVLLVDALGEMYAVVSNDGKKPKRADAAMLYECRQMVSEGHSFATAIKKWVSSEEGALIAAGEKSGNLRAAFKDALELIATRKKIIGAVVGKAIYPIFLIGILCYLLYIVATKLVPSLETAAPPEVWTGAARIMYLTSEYVTHYGIITLVALVALSVAIGLSFSRLTGAPRYRLDKFPPWSIYRMVTGAIALQNIAVLIRSGVKLHDALLLISENANAYLRERIDAAIIGTTKGLNLGEALEASEFDFPDREAVKYIRLLANRDGFDRALSNYSVAWIETSVTKVQVAMNVFFFATLLGVGACAGMIVAAGTDIQTIIEQNANRQSK